MMLKSILGHKIGMTQIFDKIGNRVPITLLTVGPCFVTQIKTIKLNGYNAIQLGYSLTSLNKLTNSKIGHLKKSNNYSLKYLREYKVDNTDNFKLGQIISINLFKDMNFVDISAKNIGKGFSGNQKRHNFSRGLMTHGSKNHRSPGSIGAGTTPGRVMPGKKMAGQLGNKKITIKNLRIIKINSIKNFIMVKGSIPGKPGNLVSINFYK